MQKIIHSGIRPFFAANDITCYILRGTDGDLLIDTGLPQTYPAMKRWLRAFDIRYVLLTHAHADHDWNAARLKTAGANILLGRRDYSLRRHFLLQPQLATSPRYILRTAFQCLGGAFIKSPRYQPDILLDDRSDILKALGFDAEVIALPGHTLGSVGVLQGNVLYCGDTFTALWGKPMIPPNVHSRALLKDSLRRILHIHPKWLACGHGLPVRMEDAEPVIREYLSK
jgi:glyoxylase-like metal-dependent hydrolase (beta-lactamase superfamily II)